jgi:tetrapyrrole methylase family protein/MazG family protein
VAPTFNPVDGLSDGYQTFAETLIAAAPAVFAVPGDPYLDEASLPLLQQIAAAANIPLRIISAQPLFPNLLRQFKLSPGTGLQMIDATLLCGYHHPPLEAHRPVVITGLYHPDLLQPLQQTLRKLYHPQTLTQTLIDNQIVEQPLTALVEPSRALYIPPQPDRPGLTHFQDVIAHLRAPNGCPWDRKQTHQTLRPFLLEETYEVLAALDEGDSRAIADELGDVLLQIALHAQIGSEAGTFQMADVVGHISQKMHRRHPHVFGDIDVDSSEEVEVNWDAIKAQEKAERGEVVAEPSVMDGVLPALPALSQALHVSRKAVKQGFEWNDAQGVLRKLIEEAHEIAEAETSAEIESEIGDFLFTAVNLARKHGIDAETALRSCNIRFMRRFRRVEQLARERSLHLPEIDKAAWFELWQQAKQDVAHLE